MIGKMVQVLYDEKLSEFDDFYNRIMRDFINEFSVGVRVVMVEGLWQKVIVLGDDVVINVVGQFEVRVVRQEVLKDVGSDLGQVVKDFGDLKKYSNLMFGDREELIEKVMWLMYF